MANNKTHSEAYNSISALWEKNGDAVSLRREKALMWLHLFNGFNGYLTSIVFLLILIIIMGNMIKQKNYFKNTLFLASSYVVLLLILLVGEIDFNENKGIVRYASEVKSIPAIEGETLLNLKEGFMVDIKNDRRSDWVFNGKRSRFWVDKKRLSH